MINSAKKYSISQLLGVDEYIKYEIPKYQREYIWGKEHWEYLFNDLIDNESGYFLGSIICIAKEKSDSLDKTVLEIVDGQQRITALSLFYAAIYEKLIKIQVDGDESAKENFIAEKNNLKHRLIQKKSEEKEPKLELSLQNKNSFDYKAILKELNLISEIGFEPPQYLGLRRIYKTYQYFKDKTENFQYSDLQNVLDKINSALLVKIEVNSHADAFTLFESLNNRGEPLSPMDLVKNKLLSKLEKPGNININQAYQQWVVFINNLGEEYSTQERFLRQYYNAFRYKKAIKIEGYSKATRSSLIKIYEKLIDKDVNFIFNELITKAEIYKQFNVQRNESNNNELSDMLLNLSYVGAAPSYSLLLYLFSEHKDNNELIKNTILFLMKYFVRRNLTDYPNTRDLDTIFMGLIDMCEANKSNLSSDFIMEYLTTPDKFSDNKVFKEKLSGDIYEDNTEVTRFILCKIEQHNQTKEIYTDLWERDKNKNYLWTIEHVFPEGENIPPDWVKMIADGDKEKAKEIQEKWVHKLGNLTLTGYNSKLSNFSLEKKRDRTDKMGKFIGYKNGLYLNKTLAKTKKWKEDDIQNRTNELVEEAMELFKI